MERWRNPQTGKLEPLSHSATLAAVRAPKRKPTAADAPPARLGPKPEVHPDQLKLSVERD